MQRLGKNLGGYFGERLDIHEVLGTIQRAALDHGWRAETFHRAKTFQWIALHRIPRLTASQQPAKRVYISTGIHGDEPAGPLAVRQLMLEQQWPEGIEITLVPCLNPEGFTANRRENAAGVDLNRDYRQTHSAEVAAHIRWLEQQPAFDMCLCLHEDWESHGFYVYELNPESRPSLAEAMVAGVAKVCPIDQSETIDGRPARDGIIRPDLDPQTRPLWPEAFWLLQHKTRLSYTLEAPSDFPLAVRVAALATGVKSALACPLLNSA